MKRREQRRQREREQIPSALEKLLSLVPAETDVRRYLLNGFVSAESADGDAWIEGIGLEALLTALGSDACPDGAMDLLRVTRRVPRTQSTAERINVAELCFAAVQASGPVNIHERRRSFGASREPLSIDTPLLQYYQGNRFRAIVKGEDPSSPVARMSQPSAPAADDAADLAEWDRFLESLGVALPMTLRVHHSEPALEQMAMSILNRAPLKDVVHPVAALPSSAGVYSCSNSEYHSDLRSQYICRTLHTASAVSFQEVVSTIPVHVLDLQPSHSVIDMCAAPGSKTLQALDEMLMGGRTSDVARGVFIANEKDRVKATQTLPARLKRYHAPNVMTTRCDGVQWPRLYRDSVVEELVEYQFDRVICDVPCSGDGTIRKEPSVATTWSASYVKSLVPTQRALLRRGLDLLKDGGVLVYSTCSINPKEDEEVVCAGLELFGDSVELIDVNSVLKEKGFALHSSGGVRSPNVEGLQQPTLPASYDGKKVLRVLPHRDDTGGFFVAAFRKLKQPNWTAPQVPRNKLNQWTKGKLWAPVAKDDENWKAIATFYGFDRFDCKSFAYYNASWADVSGGGLMPLYHLNPNGAASRRIVLASPALAEMVLRVRPYKGPGVEVVSVGMRAFEAYDGRFLPNARCRWRAVVEAASFIGPRFTSRKVLLHADRHRALLEALFRNGHVYLRDHWSTLLGGEEDVMSLNAERLGLVKPGSQLAKLVEQWRTDKGAGIMLAESEIAELLATEVDVGGVLVGVLPGKDFPEEVIADPWFISATLSGHKLELAIDGSLRAYGLMAYLGLCDEGAATPVSLEPVKVGAHANTASEEKGDSL